MKVFAGFTAFLIGMLCVGALCFIGAYVVVVDQTIPQLPGWAQEPVEEWMLDIPQDSEALDLDNDGVPDSRDHSGGDNGNDGAVAVEAALFRRCPVQQDGVTTLVQMVFPVDCRLSDLFKNGVCCMTFLCMVVGSKINTIKTIQDLIFL